MKTNFLTAVSAVIALCILLVYYRHEPWTPLRVAGAIIGFVALGLLMAARYQLGRSFAISPQARTLVTTGLYARVRNPIYMSGFLLFLGAAMFARSWWPVILTVAALPLQVYRAHREAVVLREAFGEEYERYRAGTWF